ncbi:hypothetical protein ACFHW2_11625 [Actinomadura sp. LOL_016]|uniref:hypothetical protein n=1 Tax=unclassified Actinomadura TaxID=2626254 RepID=UPI003A809148
MSWDQAVQLAVDWLDEVRTPDDGAPIVVKAAASSGGGVRPLERYEARHGSTTWRSKGTYRRRAVLAYVPGIADLQLAMTLAWNQPMCVVESGLTPLAGWAQELAAVNLLEPEVAIPELPAEVKKELDRLSFDGNNDWGDAHGRRQAQLTLQRLRGMGYLGETLEARMIARGASEQGIKNLRKLGLGQRR